MPNRPKYSNSQNCHTREWNPLEKTCIHPLPGSSLMGPWSNDKLPGDSEGLAYKGHKRLKTLDSTPIARVPATSLVIRILLKAQIQCKWSQMETGCCSLQYNPAAPRTWNYLLTKVTTFSRAASRQQHCPRLLADKCVQKIAAGKSVRPIAQATIPSIQGWWKPRLPTLT